MGLSGTRMRSNLVPTSTARLVSILKFSRIWVGRKEEKVGEGGDGSSPSPFQHKSKENGCGNKAHGFKQAFRDTNAEFKRHGWGTKEDGCGN